MTLSSVVERCWATVDTPPATLVVESDATLLANPAQSRQLLENLIRNAVEHGSTSSRPWADDAVEHGSTGNQPAADNAVEHGSAGGADATADPVTVTAGALDDGFYVADDGPGIPPDERAQVFDPGFTTADGGNGFGLYIVAQIADAHGWTVSVTESDAGGARFEVTGVDGSPRES